MNWQANKEQDNKIKLTGTKNRRTSVKAYAIRACASAGGANAVIST